MTNQTRNDGRKRQGEPTSPIESHAVDANTQIWDGMAIMQSASNGCATPCTPTASAKFIGIAEQEVNNLTGSDFGGAAAAARVAVCPGGLYWLQVAHTGTYARTDGQAQVYALDASTFTLSAGTNNVPIGKIAWVPEEVIGLATGMVPVNLKKTTL